MAFRPPELLAAAELPLSVDALPPFMTTEEVAGLLRVPAGTLRQWRHFGRGPESFRLPGARRVLYASEDVLAYIAAGRTAH